MSKMKSIRVSAELADELNSGMYRSWKKVYGPTEKESIDEYIRKLEKYYFFGIRTIYDAEADVV